MSGGRPRIGCSPDARVMIGKIVAAPTPASTRRDILRRCATGESSVSRLADAYPMSFAAVQKHVAVMERAGLVTEERRGRSVLCAPTPTRSAACDRLSSNSR